MLEPVKERVNKLRQEIAEISESSQRYMRRGKSSLETADHERRLERLQEILDELMSLTDWKKP